MLRPWLLLQPKRHMFGVVITLSLLLLTLYISTVPVTDPEMALHYEIHPSWHPYITNPPSPAAQVNEEHFSNTQHQDKARVRNVSSDFHIETSYSIPPSVTSTTTTASRTSTYIANGSLSIVRNDQVQPKMYQKALGRIGNCLFAIASLYGLSRETNHVPVLADGFMYLKNVFPNLNMSFEKLPADENVTILSERGFTKYSPERYMNVSNSDILLSGYYQSFKYFTSYDQDIRTLFEFSSDLRDNANRNLLACEQSYFMRHGEVSSLTYVGIHVRHGDIEEKSELGYRVADMMYLNKAMYYFSLRYIHVAFVLCTDSAEWSEEHVWHVDVCPPRGGSAQQDLALLVACNHTITTAGTYSWWAGWLAGGEVTYFHTPYNTSIGVGPGFSGDDFFPQHWLPISNMSKKAIMWAARKRRPRRFNI